ncbi:MAG: fibronectin type III domain-containing protein [Flavobacteriaceae bacterium]|nr:fibronectin type III domain-containing protein [Flavobacteriaceae bacterium]
MKKNHLLLILLLTIFAFTSYSQGNGKTKANYSGKVSSVEYVSSMMSRPGDLVPPDNTPREAKDKRSIQNLIKSSQDPQKKDDYFFKNRNNLEQSMERAPASLVFDTYASNSQPTDPSLAIGPNHVFVVYNTGFMIYDKSGNVLQGETAPNPAIFPSGGCCDLTVSYDNAADRWVVSFLHTSAGAQIAVSDGPNPLTAGWYVYTISSISDYQKLSVWSDGYYLTDNTSGSNKVWAMERSEMLAGNSGAQVVGFNLPGIVTSGFFSPQVLNVTDNNLPAAGGATVVYMQDDAWSGVSSDHIKLWTIDVNWSNTSNSTISSAQQINTTSFISVFDNGSFSNLAQPNGGSSLDALQATIMNQAQFRKFGSHNSAIFNFVVDTDASSGERAGVRWMEFRQSGDNQPWSLYQEGTYTAPDGRHAWNASLAMDGQGNIGMGYTSMSGPTTSSTVRVSSYFTGRMNGDPLGTMTSAEGLIANGNANFSGTRYGDYSKIDVDPSDDSSFWFITEYMNSGRKGVVGKFQLEAAVPDNEAPSDPTNLVASNITGNSATLTWNASTDNVGVIQYNISIDGSVVGTSSNTSYNVTGLLPLTLYNATVNAQDAAGNTSGNASTSFTTLEQQIEYCGSASTNTSDEYISRVQLNTIDNGSGAQFYSDFTAISTDLSEGQSYTVTVTPTWTGTIYSEGYAVWIDYNHNGDFTDSGELVWSKAASTDTPNSGSFTVPSGTSKESVRMRVSMKYNGIPTSCETFTYGEVEDYTVNLQAGGGDTEAPTTPTNLTASNITDTTVDLSWNASSDNVGVTGYEVFQDGSSIGTIASTSATVTGLTSNTSYSFTVRAYDAAGNNSALSNTANATTTSGADTEAPSVPTNLTASNITDTSVDLSWNASSDNVGVTGYEMFQNGSSIGTTTNTSSTVSGLTSNTSYTFNVRAYDAAGNNSAQSNTANATTTGGGGGGPGVIAGYYFESGLDGWIDGGSDCVRFSNSSRAYEGNYSIRIRDNSNSSNAQSPVLDLSGNTQITIEFHTYARGMEVGENFFVEFYNGSSYQIIGDYARGTDFNNNAFFTDTITLDAGTYNFNANNRFRFRNDASVNNDQIYFDAVVISGDNVTSAAPLIVTESISPIQTFKRTVDKNIILYPNPANSILNIEISEGSFDEIMVYSALGKLVAIGETGVDKFSINVSNFASGTYFVRFVVDGKAITKRFIKD